MFYVPVRWICSVRQRFRRRYLPDEQPGEVKLDQDDVIRICQRVIDNDLDTGLVADQFEISRRRVQQLAKEYRDSGDIPQLETPGRTAYAEYPEDLYDHVTDNPNKQGRRRPWVRFERQYAGVTAHMDWYTNTQGQQVLTVEDDASRRVFEMIETDASSASQSVELLNRVREDWEPPVPILEVITDHGSEFINTRQDERPCLDHEFEAYLHDHEIEHTLCEVGRPHSDCCDSLPPGIRQTPVSGRETAAIATWCRK